MSQIVCKGLIYPIIQINGQRTTGPCFGFNGAPPPESLEIYVSNIPRDLFEENLIPLFAEIGPIYKFRLMMCFSGMNRGYAYLLYTNEADTESALQKLKNFPILPHHQLKVKPSKNNCVLVMCKINALIASDAVLFLINHLIQTKRVTIINDGADRFVIIEFSKHREAALSRRTLLMNIRSFGDHCYVRWQRPIQF